MELCLLHLWAMCVLSRPSDRPSLYEMFWEGEPDFGCRHEWRGAFFERRRMRYRVAGGAKQRLTVAR